MVPNKVLPDWLILPMHSLMSFMEYLSMDDLLLKAPKVLHQPDIAVLFHDGKNGAVIVAADWLNESEIEPFEYMLFDFFAMRI
jgi:hypothetical protein